MTISARLARTRSHNPSIPFLFLMLDREGEARDAGTREAPPTRPSILSLLPLCGAASGLWSFSTGDGEARQTRRALITSAGFAGLRRPFYLQFDSPLDWWSGREISWEKEKHSISICLQVYNFSFDFTSSNCNSWKSILGYEDYQKSATE